ncbi:MAG: hypothetical protein HN348_26565 [Proteobacteria bacterium]|nr:hypothetical protein [Pseudomonadota bacterium]
MKRLAVEQVSCGGRKELWALKADICKSFSEPLADDEWPVRLLPLWDTMLMGHKDKSWTVPNGDELKAVWRRAAFVSAVVLARGRAVAVWSYKKKRKSLDIEVTALSGWRKSLHLKGVEAEAEVLAAHLSYGAGESIVRTGRDSIISLR